MITHHFRRNGAEKIVNGKLYYGVEGSKHLMVCADGTFITRNHPNGDFVGTLKNPNNPARGAYLGVRVGDTKSALAHHVVYEVCKNELIPDDCELDHCDGVGTNNKLYNLRISTHLENMRNPNTAYKQREWLARARADPGFEAKRKARQREAIDTPEHRERMRQNGLKLRKPVIGTNLSNGTERRFVSTTEAASYIDSEPGSISACCNGKLKTTAGWTFRYAS